MQQFSCHVDIDEDTATIHLAGDADLAARETMRAIGQIAFERPTIRTLIVDCSQLTFADTTMLGSLVAWRNTALPRGITLRLQDAKDQLTRIHQITKLDEVFTVDPATDDDGTMSGAAV